MNDSGVSCKEYTSEGLKECKIGTYNNLVPVEEIENMSLQNSRMRNRKNKKQ